MKRTISPDGTLLSKVGADVADLTLAEHDTLAYLLHRGMGENSLRAVRSDLSYLEAWSQFSTGRPLDWPPRQDTILRFIAHHLWDANEKERNSAHGMPEDVRRAMHAAGVLRSTGPHAASTVSRRISSWRAICRWKGAEGPFATPDVKRALTAAIRASGRPRKRHSRLPIGISLVEELLNYLDALLQPDQDTFLRVPGARLRARRDRALIATMFASGGRRRSEIANLVLHQVHVLESIPVEEGEPLISVGLWLGRTKTTGTVDDARVFLSGRAAEALLDWLRRRGAEQGPVFVGIDRWGTPTDKALNPATVNTIVKNRLEEIGHDPRDFSSHGVRAGYITSALKAGIPAPEVMEQTLHRSLDTLLGYFKDDRQREGRAARLL